MASAPFMDILVYLDGSEGSLSALMYSIMLARSTDARLHALYVVNTKALNDLVMSHIFVDTERSEFLADLEKDASRHIRHAEKLALQKGMSITSSIIEGTPHQEVISYIKNNNIDLLVLGPVNVIRSRREELTSENDRMLRTSPSPVLVVKDDENIWNMFEEEY